LIPCCAAELWGTFRKLAQAGSTLLISSHVMDEAGECDQLLLMREGALLEQTTPKRLRESTGEQDLGRAFLAIIAQVSS
jgi:ABC-2 type transport system ATP-binding protein